ncbi:RHS repeat-associated core domain-containing protein [Lentzea sp. NPDC051208]|uniref:RHS repeat-associated core domain-containing protein n=1 Tax=Lentzea sp. NPDC051208 TaxID=3154642 RepID=UPI00343EC070
MTRPAAGEWSVLDEDDDPIPGDPAALVALRDAYRELGSVTQEAFQLLNGSGDIDGGIGRAMDAYRALYGEVPKRLNDMAYAYGQAADAYARYMPSLEEAQAMSLNALNQARTAVQEQNSANSTVAGLTEAIERVAAAGLGVAPPEDSQTDLRTAQNRQAEASQELDRAKSLLGQAIALRDQAAATTSQVLHQMGDLAPQRSIWEKIGDAFKDFFDFLVDVVADILTIVLDVLSVIAGFIFPPLGWALGVLSSSIEIFVAVLKDDMVALGIALGGLALSFVPGGKIMKNVVKLSNKVGDTVKSGIQKISTSFSGGAGRTIDVAIPPPRTITPPDGTRGLNTPPRPNAQPNPDKVVAGDPIDVSSGRMLLPQTDLVIDGALPLVLARIHVSTYRSGRWFGPSWASTADQRLEIDAQGITFLAEDGTLLAYPHPGDGEVLPEEGPRWPLSADADGGYVVRQPSRQLRFLPVADDRVLPIAEVVDQEGNGAVFSYDDEGTLTEVAHSSGSRVQVTTEDGRITALDVAGVRISYRYESGNLAEVVDSSGGTTRFRYGSDNRIVRWDDSNGMWYEYFYDDRNRCVRTRGAEGFLSYRLEYGNGRTTVTDSLGRTTVYDVNEAFQVVRETNAAGVVESTWDRYDRLLTRTDPLGNTTRYDYDTDGNLVRVTGPDGAQTSAEYLAPGLPSRYVLPDGAQWNYEYDEEGRLTAEVDPAGARTTFSHDGYVTTVVDPLRRHTSTEYNFAGLPVRVTDALGAQTLVEYDAFGRASEVTEATGETTRITWGSSGKPVEVVLPNGAREEFSYDGEGNLVRAVSAQGAVTNATYGHFDVPVSVETPADGRIELSYDTESRLTGVTNALGQRWLYEYGPAGTVVREVDFDGREQRFVSDAMGRVTELHNASGQSAHLEWDAHGRPVSRRTDEGVTTFEHDKAGRVVRAVWPGGELSRTYDALGRLLTETVNGRTLTNSYDAAGRRTGRITPSGATSAWRYGFGDQPEVVEIAGRTTELVHNVLGQETRRATGAVEVTQQWASGRLRAQHVNGTSRDYRYRPDGALVGIADSERGVREYEVDGAGRVVAVRGDVDERYSYDESGLLTESVLGAHHYDGMNVRQAGGIRYDHDADGRIVRREQDGRVWRFRWDVLDQLIAVVTPDGEHWRYRYDPFGRRVAKHRVTPDGAEVLDRVEFTWDADELAEQRHDDAVMVWDGYHQVERSGDQSWSEARFRVVVTDFAGTPAELLEEDGTVSWRAEHTLWGLGAPGDTPLRFPGQYHDAETGLHHNRYRYYDPASGRYASKDPLGLTPAADPRSYVLNPTGWVDPLGLAPCPIAEFNKIHNTPDGPSLIIRGPDHHRKLDFLGKSKTSDTVRNKIPVLGPGVNKITDPAEFNKITGPHLPPARNGKIVFNQDAQTLTDFHSNELGPHARNLAKRQDIFFSKGSEALEQLGRNDPRTKKFYEAQDLRDKLVAKQSAERNAKFDPGALDTGAVDDVLKNTAGRMGNVNGLLGRFDGVAIGGSHGTEHPVFDVLKNNMAELKANGVNKIYMESLRNDAHGAMVKDFLRTGQMDPRLDHYLKRSPNLEEVRQVLEQARRHDVDVIGIGGNPARTPSGPDALHQRHAMLNALGADSVEFHQKQNPGKFVMELGAKHLETVERAGPPVNVGGVDLPNRSIGIGDLVKVPSLVDDGAGGFRRVPSADDVR